MASEHGNLHVIEKHGSVELWGTVSGADVSLCGCFARFGTVKAANVLPGERAATLQLATTDKPTAVRYLNGFAFFGVRYSVH